MDRRGMYLGFGGKTRRKRPLRIPTHSWVNNNKMNLGYLGSGVMDWFDLAQDGH
jgi:hypothetical protein